MSYETLCIILCFYAECNRFADGNKKKSFGFGENFNSWKNSTDDEYVNPFRDNNRFHQYQQNRNFHPNYDEQHMDDSNKENLDHRNNANYLSSDNLKKFDESFNSSNSNDTFSWNRFQNQNLDLESENNPDLIEQPLYSQYDQSKETTPYQEEIDNDQHLNVIYEQQQHDVVYDKNDLSKVNEVTLEAKDDNDSILKEDILDEPFGGINVDIDCGDYDMENILGQLGDIKKGLSELSKSIKHEQCEGHALSERIEQMQNMAMDDSTSLHSGDMDIAIEKIPKMKSTGVGTPNQYIGKKRRFGDALNFDFDMRANKRQRLCG